MKRKKRIKLLKSQKLLLDMKGIAIAEAIVLMQGRQSELQATLNMIITEHGVSGEELNQWRLTEDGQAIEWTKPEKPKKNKKNKEKEKK